MAYNGNTLDLGLGLDGGALPAGEIRRLYAFGNSVSELAVSQTPFFRLLSQYAKSPVNDPEFKGLEQRHQWQKRYVFVEDIGADTSETVNSTAYTTHAGTAKSGSTPAYFTGAQYKALVANDLLDVTFCTDYKNTGEWKKDGAMYNVAGSCPEFLVVGQVIHIPVFNSDAGATNDDVSDYGSLVVRIKDKEISSNAMQCIVEVVAKDTLYEIAVADTAIDDADIVYIGAPGIKNRTGTSNAKYDPAAGTGMPTSTLDNTVVNFEVVQSVSAGTPREKRCYISGSAHAEGSSYPDAWKDVGLVDTYGFTQIFKTSCDMNNTARATVLRGIPNEWARMWKERLIEHKRDIEMACLFGEKWKGALSPAAGGTGGTGIIRTTQGAVPYIRDNGYVFNFEMGAKTMDSFIDDLGEFMHPEKGDISSTVYMCPTNVFSYLSKVGTTGFGHQSLNGSAMVDFQNMSVKNIAGLNFTQISTPHGTMNLVKNVQLDGTNVKILGVNLKHVKYRPLAGNGMSRDTSIYVGVQSLENTGTDKRVDLIQTEAGLDWGMPEAHAVWL